MPRVRQMRQRNMLQMKKKKKKSENLRGEKKLHKMEISNILEKMLLFKVMVIKLLTELRRR